MKEIMILVFVFVSASIPIIFIYKDITDLHEMLIKIMEIDAKEFIKIDERLKKLEHKNKKNKEEK